MWYLTQHSLSPLDDRYTGLPIEFIEFSYYRFMNNISYEKIRDINVKIQYDKKKEEEEKKDLDDQYEVLSSGRTKEEADKIFQAYKDAVV